MPMYDVQCKVCGVQAEVFTAYSRLPRVRCAVCGGSVRQVYKGRRSVGFRPFEMDLGGQRVQMTSHTQYRSELDRRGLVDSGDNPLDSTQHVYGTTKEDREQRLKKHFRAALEEARQL